MSARQVCFQQISCNGCGVEYPQLGAFVAKVREQAAKDGWKHLQVRYADSNWAKQVDLCPTCEEPKQ